MTPVWSFLLNLALGASLVLAFAPFSFWPLAVLALALLFMQWWNADPRTAALVGFAFGLGLFLAGVSWVYVSLRIYGGMPVWMGIVSVLGFAALLAVFPALAGWMVARLGKAQSWNRLWLMPAAWVLCEWLKSWVLTGFPWLEIGYSQTNSWLFALAPLGGVYLVTFATAWAAVLLVLIYAWPAARIRATVAGLVLLSMLVLLERIQWTEPFGPELRVGLVQPNVDVRAKWQAEERDRTLTSLAKLSADLHREQAVDLLVWPETAVPAYRQQLSAEFWQQLVPQGAALISGLMDAPGSGEVYNAAILVCDDGQQHMYRKQHLVPFGEYLPLKFLFAWVLDYLNLPMSDFSAWQGQQTIRCDGQLNLGVSICYEDAFAGEMRRHMRAADLLVNISEDAWFGDSLAPHQRVQMAQMRARELGRPMLRAANSGPSVIISAQGELLSQTGQFASAVLGHSLMPHRGRTPYAYLGNWIVWLSLLALAAVLLVRRSR